jgi:hypothetical protein
MILRVIPQTDAGGLARLSVGDLLTEGLADARHDTFKVRGPTHALVVVGSSNLTRDGLYRNIEGSAAIDLDRANAAGAETFGREVHTYRLWYYERRAVGTKIDEYRLRMDHTTIDLTTSGGGERLLNGRLKPMAEPRNRRNLNGAFLDDRLGRGPRPHVGQTRQDGPGAARASGRGPGGGGGAAARGAPTRTARTSGRGARAARGERKIPATGRILFLTDSQMRCRTRAMKAKRTKLSDGFRRAIHASALAQAEICRAIGLDQAVLCRFMQGKSGLSVQNLDALADVLGLAIVQLGKPAPIPKGRPGRKRKAGGK